MSNNSDAIFGFGLAVGAIFSVVGIVGLCAWGCPRYSVYSAEMDGHAKYAEAESSRKIVVLEAQSKKDSAKLLSEADVARAHGVAEANQIIGNSLKDNEAYLRYLWIHGLEGTKNQIIYVPTEASLPILESTRHTLNSPPSKKE